jgi:hypothetical protein
MKTFLEISSVGSACKKNRYEPMKRTLLGSIIRHDPELAKNYLINSGYVKKSDSNKRNKDSEIFSAYSKTSSGVNNPDNFKNIEDDTINKIKSSIPEFTKEDLSRAKVYVQESIKKDCGKNVEKEVITQKNYCPGNKKMHYFPIGKSVIGGLHDAISDGMVIEIKTRMSLNNVRKNEYDLYQLIGYLLAMNIPRGKIVQKFKNQVFDSDSETESEYGVVDLTEDKWKSIAEIMKSELSEYFKTLNNILETKDTSILDNVFPENDSPIAKLNNNSELIYIDYKYQKFLKCFNK